MCFNRSPIHRVLGLIIEYVETIFTIELIQPRPFLSSTSICYGEFEPTKPSNHSMCRQEVYGTNESTGNIRC